MTSAPLHVVNEQRLAEAAEHWRPRLEERPAPRVALLVGGTSGQYRLGPATARRLGQDVARWGREMGASIFASTSRRTGDAAVRALAEGLGDDAYLHRWKPDDVDNPYLGFLALADALVITADSESMLAEAVSLGRPVYVYPLPQRASFALLRRAREWAMRRAYARPRGERGTGRPQQGLAYACARAIDRGFVRPTRDLELLKDDLVARGWAARFGEAAVPARAPGHSETDQVAERVRALMGLAS